MVLRGRGGGLTQRASAPSAGALVAAGLVALALVVRLSFLSVTADYRPDHDDRNYDWLARSVARTGAYPTVKSADGPRATAFRPPGYPYALGGLYRAAGVTDASNRERWRAARRAQAVLGAIAVGLLGLLAGSLFGRWVAWVAMALATSTTW